MTLVQCMAFLLGRYGAMIGFRRCVDPEDWRTMLRHMRTRDVDRHVIDVWLSGSQSWISQCQRVDPLSLARVRSDLALSVDEPSDPAAP
jgi:hypothetical protein